MKAEAGTSPPLFAAIVRRWSLAGIVFICIFSVIAMIPYSGATALLDLPSHFPLQYLIGIAVIAALGRYARLGAGSYASLAISAALCLYLIAAYIPRGDGVPPSSTASLKVLQANVLFLNKDAGRLQKLIEEEKPDIIILAEANKTFTKMLGGLRNNFPYQNARPDDTAADGIAVASHIKLENLRVLSWKGAGMPAYAFSVKLKGHDIHVLGIHTPNPIHDIAGRDAALAGVAGEIASAHAPFFIAGDFNATPWCPAMRHLTAQIPGLHNAREGRGFFPSWPAFLPPFMRIPIDQTMMSDDISVQDYRLGPDIGSDHFPVISVLALKEAK